MPLFNFFNRNRNNNQNNFNRNNNQNFNNFNNNVRNNFNNNIPNQNQFQNFNNNLPKNNLPIQQFQPNINNGVNLRPITQEDMEKLQKEIQENIKLSNEKRHLSNSEGIANSLDKFELNISEFLQNEKNSTKFYEDLSKKFNDKNHILAIEKISLDCNNQLEILNKMYLEKNKEEYKFEEKSININLPLKDALTLAINEELVSYEKICEILEKNIDFNIKSQFNKMAFNKLKRITSLQFILLQHIN